VFRRRYPGIRVNHLQAVVEHERIVTGPGLAADTQLLARLVELTTTPELARWLADVTGLHQTTEDGLAEDPLVANAQLWLEERFAQDVQITDLATAMAVSHQTLLRHFNRHLGVSPRSYVQRLRMEAAQRLLLRTSRPIEQIATLVGYDDVHSFRKVFRTHTGSSASRFRAKNSASGPDSK
jgi:transcriptional regulator GlxA family with amidase domain